MRIVQVNNLATIFLVFFGFSVFSQQGIYVPASAEVFNYGEVNLLNNSGLWSTQRSANPGYFSVTGQGVFLNVDDNNNIDGYVKYYSENQNLPFDFPIGNGHEYRRLSINGNIQINSIFASAWIDGDPTITIDPTDALSTLHPITQIGSGLSSVSTIGQWDWQDFTNTSNGLKFTVSIPNLSSYASAAELRLVGWNGSFWENLSGNTGAATNTINSSLSGTLTNNITAIAIGKSAQALPITLVSFVGKIFNKSIKLDWKSEQGLEDYSELQKSINGLEYFSLGIFYKANSTNISNLNYYSYSDFTPNFGNNYYRLKMVNSDGTIKISKILNLFYDNNETYFYVENPIEGNNLNIYSNIKNPDFTLWDIKGSRLKFSLLKIEENKYKLFAFDITKGVYFLQIQNETINERKKILVDN